MPDELGVELVSDAVAIQQACTALVELARDLAAHAAASVQLGIAIRDEQSRQVGSVGLLLQVEAAKP